MIHPLSSKKLVIIGNTRDCDIGEALLGSSVYDIVGGIIDARESDETQALHRSFLESNDIPEITFDGMLDIMPDAALMITYSKVVAPKYVNAVKMLNLHGGLLPKWRGTSSSSWAIINNEKEIGYTLHAVDEGLDSGPIYHRFAVDIDEDEKFGDVRPRIRVLVCKEIKELIEDILLGTLHPVSQDGCEYTYTMPFRKSDGKIDWKTDSQHIYNLYRVLGYPYGSGIYFTYKDKTYEATKISKVKNIQPYIGIYGAVVNKTDSSIFVKTKDTMISIDEVRCEGEFLAPSEIFMIGNRLS